MTEPFRARDSDHLKPGEFVRVVAINRATGYMGTQRVQLASVNAETDSELDDSRGLAVIVPDMTLRPPNLKIWAERDTTITGGITQGEERTYLIGSEGAALASDTIIRIYTEWLDHDGSALPYELGLDNGEQYGLSGRLAKIVASNTLGGVSDLANFPIAPGLRTQVVRVGDNLTSAEHFYIHVSGTAKDESPDFDGGELDPPYENRPNKLTPFMVPLYNEDKHWQTYNEYRRLQKEFDASTDPDAIDPDKPHQSDYYAWNYRPEYQFSQFELELHEINRVQNAGTPEEDKTNILDLTTPTLSNTDDLIEFLYSLIGSDFERLTPIDGEQELILSLGEEETAITLGEDRTITFNNLAHLASLAPEDYLSMRLYTNNDAGNILWEYAFETLILDTQLAGYDPGSGEPLYVSADEPVVPLQAFVPGYASRSPATKQPLLITWTATNGATLATSVQEDGELGVFFNEISLPSVAGFQTQVSVNLINGSSSKSSLPPIIVVPGEPAQISFTSDNNLVSVDGAGERSYTFTIRDQHNNLIADGTGVSFVAGDSLQVVSFDDATAAGVARVTVKGGQYTGAADLTLKVGALQTQIDLDIQPLTVTVTADATTFPGQSETVTVTVTDQNGQPVPNTELLIGSTYGYIRDTELTTDANGQATTTYTAPDSDGEGEITAQAGRSPLGRTTIEVVYPSMEDRDLEVDHASMVGDISADGAIIHNRYDGTEIQVAARAQDTIQAIGQQGDNVTITIGDIRDPNLAPIAAYYMNDVHEDVVQDDTGRYHLQATGVTRAIGTAMGAGHSLRFQTDNDPSTDGNQGSKLFTDNLTLLQQTQNIGFSIEVRPLGGSTGTLVNLGQGAQTLAFNQYGQLEYRIQTDTGTYSVNTPNAILPGTWHKIAARYHNGQIELWVNGTSYTDTASGNLSHTLTGYTQLADIANPANNHDLVIGDGFGGQINSLKWYNWNGQPVMTFADGTTQTTVTLPAPTDGTNLARQELVVRSTGRLQENGSQLGLLRVAIHTNKVRQYASLLSTDTFSALAGQYVNTLATDAPPINLSGLTPQQNLLGNPVWPQTASHSFLISNAYAAEESSLAWDVFNFFIPVESIGVLVEQLQYLVSDPDKFDATEFIIALVDTITILPPAKPLKAFIRPLQAMTKVLRPLNPKFTKHFAGAFGKMWSKIKKGDTDTLLNLLPFLVIAAEMYSDEEARKGLEFLVKTVASPDDIIAWIDYLALPADGWDGEGPPPQVEAFPDESENAMNSPFDIFVGNAYAAGKLKRVSSHIVGAALNKASQRIAGEELKNIPQALAALSKELRKVDAQTIRKYIFNPSLIVSTTALFAKRGVVAIKNFVKGRTNARYSQLTIIATVAYLEWEASCGKALDIVDGEYPESTPEEKAEAEQSLVDLECNGNGLTGSKNRRELYNLFRRAFQDTLTGNYDEDKPNVENYEFSPAGHGALFHMNQLAQALLEQRAGGPKLKAVEGVRWVWLYKNSNARDDHDEDVVKDSQFFPFSYQRNVDLIVQEEGKAERWIELKSYKAWENGTTVDREKLALLKGKQLVVWGLGKGTNKSLEEGLHKQFMEDRSVAYVGHARLQKDNNNEYIPVNVSPNFQWRFQQFKVKLKNSNKFEYSIKLGSASNPGTVLHVFNQPIQDHSGTNKDLHKANWGDSFNASSHVDVSNIKDFLQRLATVGFKEAADAMVEELIEE